MIEDLKRQHMDTPEEIFQREDVMRKKQVGTIEPWEHFSRRRVVCLI